MYIYIYTYIYIYRERDMHITIYTSVRHKMQDI